MMKLTPRQAELLSFIERYTAENGGVAPTFEEMMLAVDLASKSGIHRLLGGLEERGRIRRLRDRARAIEVLTPAPATGLDIYSTQQLLAEVSRRSRLARERRLAA